VLKVRDGSTRHTSKEGRPCFSLVQTGEQGTRGGTGAERSLVGVDGVGGIEGGGVGTVEVPGGAADVRTDESVEVSMGETDGFEVELS
jgi:hypothetical protein